jgi:prevent-host-death family protein
MTAVGIRELKQNASAVIRRVKAGESIEVTERGQPVARLVPIREPVDVIEQLIAEGRAARPVGSLDDVPAPITLPKVRPSPSTVLAELRVQKR